MLTASAAPLLATGSAPSDQLVVSDTKSQTGQDRQINSMHEEIENYIDLILVDLASPSTTETEQTLSDSDKQKVLNIARQLLGIARRFLAIYENHFTLEVFREKIELLNSAITRCSTTATSVSAPSTAAEKQAGTSSNTINQILAANLERDFAQLKEAIENEYAHAQRHTRSSSSILFRTPPALPPPAKKEGSQSSLQKMLESFEVIGSPPPAPAILQTSMTTASTTNTPRRAVSPLEQAPPTITLDKETAKAVKDEYFALRNELYFCRCFWYGCIHTFFNQEKTPEQIAKQINDKNKPNSLTKQAYNAVLEKRKTQRAP